VSGSPRSNGLLPIASSGLLGLSLLIVAGVAVAYVVLALPVNDDWVRCVQPRRLGWLVYFKFVYTKWQGRWVSEILETTLLPLGNVIKTYPALLGGVLLVNLLGIYVVCRFFTRGGSRWFSLACTIGLAGMLWAEMPSVAQAVFWFVGAVENAMPIALGGVLLVGLISLGDSVLWIVAASVFAIVICGLHECYGAMLCIALATGTLAAYWMNSTNKRVWLIVLVAAVVGVGIVAAAPGNRLRLQSDGATHAQDSAQHLKQHLVSVLKLAGIQFISSAREWLCDPALLAVSLWVAFSPRLEAARPVFPTSRRVPWWGLIPLAWIAMLAVGFIAPSLAFGTTMPGRTLSGNFMVFAIGWVVIVFVWTRAIGSRHPGQASANSLQTAGASAVARLVLAIGLLLASNTLDGVHDLANRYTLHCRASLLRRFALLRAPGPDDRVVPRLLPSSHLLYDGEIGSDPADWHNWPLAYYFGLTSVRVLPTTSPGSAVTTRSTDQEPL
jgi:hypothetical protein